MTWTDVAGTGDLGEGQVCVVIAGGKRIALCHPEEGGFYAIADVCTHDGAPLDQGELLDSKIECPRHGAQFDIKTGKALTLPAVRPVKTYPVRVENGRVEVDVS
jgi:3-phenylpropionate/trans-cinnamate dioxygenase ferredoxin subunit